MRWVFVPIYSVKPTNGDGDFTFARTGEATRVNQGGNIETVATNVPRIDHFGGGCPSLLLENASTNQLTRSSDFDNWSKINITVASDSLISPSGELDADTLTRNSALTSYVSKSFSKTSSSELDSTKYEDYGNGWYRLSAKFNTDAYPTLACLFSPRSLSGQVDSTDSASDSSVYLWGAQCEYDNLSSFIPTTTAAVTRNAESCTDAGDVNVFNSLEGVLYAQMAANSDELTYRYVSISDGTNQNSVAIRFSNTSNQILAFTRIGGNFTAVISTSSYTTTNFNKIAYRYKSGDFALFINGTKISSSTSTQIYPQNTLNTLNFNDGQFAPMSGKVKDLRYYDSALTDQQLTELTT